MTQLRLKGWVVVKAGQNLKAETIGSSREDAITKYCYDAYNISFYRPQYVEKVWAALKDDDIDVKEIDVEIEI